MERHQVTDAIAHRLERLIRELTADRHSVDAPDAELHAVLARKIDLVRPLLARQDALRLETLAQRLTGVAK